jgi:hypothetical protein
MLCSQQNQCHALAITTTQASMPQYTLFAFVWLQSCHVHASPSSPAALEPWPLEQ